MNIEKNRDFIHKMKEYVEAITVILTIVTPVVGLIINRISEQLSYGYFSYYGLEKLSLKDSPVNSTNYWFIISLLFLLVVLIIFSILIKIIYYEKNRFETALNVVLFSFLLVNIVIIVVIYFDTNDYLPYFIVLIIISVLQFASTFLKKFNILKILFILTELVLIGVFCKWGVLIVYISLAVFFAVLLIYSSIFINIKPKNNDENYTGNIKTHEVNTDSKLSTIDKYNKIKTNYSPEFICKFIVVVMLMGLVMIIGTRNYMIDIGKDLATYNTSNIIAIDGDNTYLCFYTMDNDIVGIPVTIDSDNGVDQIIIISKVYRYINKESNIIYTMKKTKVISE